MAKKKIIKFTPNKDNTVSIALGREETKMTPDEVTNIIHALVAMRQQMMPPVVASDAILSPPIASHPTGMRWSAVGVKGQPGVEIAIGHPGFGWLSMHQSPTELKRLISELLRCEQNETATKQ